MYEYQSKLVLKDYGLALLVDTFCGVLPGADYADTILKAIAEELKISYDL